MVSQFVCVCACTMVMLFILYSDDAEGKPRLTERQRLWGFLCVAFLAFCASAFLGIARWL